METKSIILILACAFVTYGFCSLIETGDIYMNLGLKSLVGLLYVVALYLMKFFRDDEIQKFKGMIRTRIAKLGLKTM